VALASPLRRRGDGPPSPSGFRLFEDLRTGAGQHVAPLLVVEMPGPTLTWSEAFRGARLSKSARRTAVEALPNSEPESGFRDYGYSMPRMAVSRCWKRMKKDPTWIGPLIVVTSPNVARTSNGAWPLVADSYIWNGNSISEVARRIRRFSDHAKPVLKFKKLRFLIVETPK